MIFILFVINRKGHTHKEIFEFILRSRKLLSRDDFSKIPCNALRQMSLTCLLESKTFNLKLLFILPDDMVCNSCQALAQKIMPPERLCLHNIRGNILPSTRQELYSSIQDHNVFLQAAIPDEYFPSLLFLR